MSLNFGKESDNVSGTIQGREMVTMEDYRKSYVSCTNISDLE